MILKHLNPSGRRPEELFGIEGTFKQLIEEMLTDFLLESRKRKRPPNYVHFCQHAEAFLKDNYNAPISMKEAIYVVFVAGLQAGRELVLKQQNQQAEKIAEIAIENMSKNYHNKFKQ